MNLIVKVSLTISGILFIVLIGFLGYLGVFSTLSITEKTMGPYTYAYKSFTGDYKLTGPVFGEVWEIMKTKNIPAELGIGVYYDDPASVPTEKLRSDCGFIISDQHQERAISAGLKIGNFAKMECVIVEFPIRNSLSYMIGPMKVYPALAAYAETKKYESTEIGYELYDEKNKKTIFVMKIVK